MLFEGLGIWIEIREGDSTKSDSDGSFLGTESLDNNYPKL
jgi:hypothetical protein